MVQLLRSCAQAAILAVPILRSQRTRLHAVSASSSLFVLSSYSMRNALDRLCSFISAPGGMGVFDNHFLDRITPLWSSTTVSSQRGYAQIQQLQERRQSEGIVTRQTLCFFLLHEASKRRLARHRGALQADKLSTFG